MWSRFKFVILTALIGRVRAARANGAKIGSDCRIGTSYFGTEPWLISIGHRVTVTSGVRFITHDGATCLVRDHRGRRFRFAPITIDDDTFIGTNCIILPGVRIGSRSIVAAGSVVSRSVPSGSIVAGVPARVIGTFDEYERKVLNDYPAKADMLGRTFRKQVDSIVNCSMVNAIELEQRDGREE